MAKPRRKPKPRGFRHRRLKVEGVPTGIEQLWLVISFTKQRVLRNCALQFHFQYVEHLKKPQAVILTVGSALHYMGKQFFMVNYKTPASFAGAWSHFWMGVVRGKWGPGARQEDPVAIDWEYEKEPYVWKAKGQKILKEFFERHADHRGTHIGRANEIGFLVPWRNFFLKGKIDRIDEYDVYVEIIDYKMGAFLPLMLALTGSNQVIFYKLGYEHDLFRSFNHKPLSAIRVENLFTGNVQTFETRGPEEEEVFYQGLREDAWYLQSIYGRPQSIEDPIVQTNRFPTDRQGRYVLWPRLPRDKGHCQYCPFHQECVDFERQYRQLRTAPNGRQLWANAKHLRLAPSLARQPSLFDL